MIPSLPTGQSLPPHAQDQNPPPPAQNQNLARWLHPDEVIPDGAVDVTPNAQRAGVEGPGRLVVPVELAGDVLTDLKTMEDNPDNPLDPQVVQARKFLADVGVMHQTDGDDLGASVGAADLESGSERSVGVRGQNFPELRSVRIQAPADGVPTAVVRQADGEEDEHRFTWKNFKESLSVSSVVHGAVSAVCLHATVAAGKAVSEEFNKPIHANSELLYSRVLFPMVATIGFGAQAVAAFRHRRLELEVAKLRSNMPTRDQGGWDANSDV